MENWCKYCSGSYPIYTCGVTKKLASEYEHTYHCMNGGNQCQKKVDYMKEQKKQGFVKKLVKSIIK